MCTTTDENKPRELKELLNLQTYQGMTDEEIDIVLEYKINYALTTRENLMKTEALIAYSEQRLEDSRAVCRETQELLKSLIDREPQPLEPMQPKTFTPRSTEVSNG